MKIELLYNEIVLPVINEIENSIVKFIFKENIKDIYKLIDDYLNKKSLFKKIIVISIDFIQLCQRFPEKQDFFMNFYYLNKSINNVIAIITHKILSHLKFQNLSVIPGISSNDNEDIYQIHNYSINLIRYHFITFPTTAKCTRLSIKYIEKIFENDDDAIIKQLYNSKQLISLEGRILLSKSRSIRRMKHLICNNENCPKRLNIISFDNNKNLEYSVSDLLINESFRQVKLCKFCKSSLLTIDDFTEWEYIYTISYNNIIIKGISNTMIAEDREVVGLNGYFTRIDKGNKIFRIMNYNKKICLFGRYSKIKIGNFSLEDLIKQRTESITQNEVNEADQSLVVILNIFNLIKLVGNSKLSNIDIPSSPISQAEDSILFGKNIKIIIFTNDVVYVKHIAKTFLPDIKVVFRVADLIGNRNMLCIVDKNDTNNIKYRKLATHEFIVEISNILNYSYLNNLPNSFRWDFYGKKKELKCLIQEIYIDLRKKFKNIITPKKLFIIVESLILSIDNVSNSVYSNETLRKYFYNNCYQRIA